MSNILFKKTIEKFKKDKIACLSLFFFIIFTIFIFSVSYFFDKNYFSVQNPDFINCAPSKGHIFGTDTLGRDLFIRTIVGSQISLIIAFIAAIIAVSIGTLYGMIAGFYGGKIDNVMMRFIDGLSAIPFIFLSILFFTIFGNNFLLIFISIACVSWLDIARIIRGQTLSIKNKEFIYAAKISGLSNYQIIIKHIFPNLFGSIMVYSTLIIPNILSLSTFLGFLGFGIQPPMVGLGELISDGSMQIIFGQWWLLIFPCLFLFCILISLFFISNGVKNAINSKN